MTTYPLPTLACTVSDAGISAPSYNDILESLKAEYRSIFGSDVYVEADSQDGQMLAIFATAINDCNSQTIATYNAFSPATAKGAGLSSVVKINGLQRHIPSNSTSDLTIVGQAFTDISDGAVGDANGNKWLLPTLVTIPFGGSIVVTGTCTTPGAVDAPANTINQILTPTLGWQTVTNLAAATPGAPVEDDADLRIRQSVSTALAAETPLKAVIGAVASITGVTRYAAYENDTNLTDANGLPPHSVAMVVEGGDAQAIAEVIFAKKGIGPATYGSTTEVVLDPAGVPKDVKFSRPAVIAIKVEITLHPLSGFTSTIEDALSQAVVDSVNSLIIGADVVASRLQLPAQLYGAPSSATYEVNPNGIRIAKVADAFGTADIVIAFDEVAMLDLAHVTVVIV